MKITAKGKRGNQEITIVATKNGKGKYVFEISGCETIFRSGIEEMIKRELQRRYVFAGTFIPKVYSDINIMNVLQNYFFDELQSFSAEDIEQMPFEEGVVY